MAVSIGAPPSRRLMRERPALPPRVAARDAATSACEDAGAPLELLMKAIAKKCMEAGASDSITKPIDAQQLVSLLRVWLYR